MTSIREFIETAYANHKTMLFSEVVEENGHKALIYGSLHRKPAEVFMLIEPSGAKTPVSVSFKDNAGRNGPEKRRENIRKVAKRILNDESFRDPDDDKSLTRAHASQAIELFGLFGLKPQIGDQIKTSFLTELDQLPLSQEEREAVLSSFKIGDLIRSDLQRLRKPISDLQGLKIHPDTHDALGALTEYDWGALRFYASDDEKGMLRRQSAKAFPTLAGFFPSNMAFSRTVIDTQLDPDLEKRKHLDNELGKIFGVSGKTLKRLKGVSYLSNNLSHSEIVEACSSIPPDWIPKTKEDWESFSILVRTIGRGIGKELKLITSNPYEFLFKGCKGKWTEFHKRCVLAFAESRPPQGLTDEQEQKVRNLRGSLKDALQADKSAFQKKIDKGLSKIDFVNDAQKVEVAAWLMEMYEPDMGEDPLLHASAVALEMVEFIAEEVCLPAASLPLLLSSGASIESFRYTEDIKLEAKKSALMLTICPDLENTSTGKAIPNILEAARLFLNNQVGIQNKVFDTQNVRPTLDHIPEGHWAPLFHGVFELDDDYYFQPLTSPQELTYEGRGTGHGEPGPFDDEPRRNEDGSLGLSFCVGSYARYCQAGRKQIISLRRRTPNASFPYERVATLELDLPSDIQSQRYRSITEIPALQTGQFYGLHNTTVDDSTEARKETLMQAISNRELSLNTVELSTYAEIANETKDKKVDPVRSICMYDWQSPQNINNAMFALGRLIHKEVTKSVKSVSDLVKHPSMEGLMIYVHPERGMEVISRQYSSRPDTAPGAMTASGRRMF